MLVFPTSPRPRYLLPPPIKMSPTQPWQAVAAGRKAAQQASIDALGYKVPTVSDTVLNVATLTFENQLSSLDNEITEATGGVGSLLEKLASGSWSAEAVVVSGGEKEGRDLG